MHLSFNLCCMHLTMIVERIDMIDLLHYAPFLGLEESFHHIQSKSLFWLLTSMCFNLSFRAWAARKQRLDECLELQVCFPELVHAI